MSVQIMIRVTAPFKEAAEARAKAESRTLSGWVKALMETALGMEGATTSMPSRALEVPDDVAGGVTPVVKAPAPGKPPKIRCSKHKRLSCKLCGGG